MRVLMERSPDIHVESGAAMVFTIMLVLLLAGLGAAVTQNSRGALDRSKQRTHQVLNTPAMESALAKYRFALQTNQADDRNDFVLESDVASGMLEEGGPANARDEVLVNWSDRVAAPYRTQAGIYDLTTGTRRQFPVNGRFTVRERLHIGSGGCARMGVPTDRCGSGTQLHSFWQVYRIDLPDYSGGLSNGNLVTYFRSWVGTSDASFYTAARVVRAEFRPGRFADFQMLADGPIRFEPGANIQGPVHSNGFRNDIISTVQGPERISGAGLNCGGQASFSTAKGSINVSGSGCNGATRSPDNGKFVSFLRTEDSFARMKADAALGDPNVHVYNTGYAGEYGVYRVRLSSGRVEVSTPNGNETYYSAERCVWTRLSTCWSAYRQVKTSKQTAFLFNDDVVVEGGYTDGRVTIGARRDNLAAGAANIYIEGDIGTELRNGRPSPRDTLGLLAQGSIIVQQGLGTRRIAPCDVSNIRAAMVAASGSVSIPATSVTDAEQATAPYCNGNINIVGSVAGHRTSVMHWQWPSGKRAGYARRTYSWDPIFRKNTPPYFPLTDTWQVTNYREANADCLTIRQMDGTCR